MIDFFNGQITDILPFNIAREPEVKAISHALRKGTQMLYKYAMWLYLWTDIDKQPENVLDLMAAELRTQYYRQDLDIEAKRRLVKGTLAWYMTAGTPEAVEELVAAVFGEGRVSEWFEYGDKPYYFKIETNAILTPDILDTFGALIYRVKNTRSHLRAIDIHRIVNHELFSGAAVFPNYKPPAVIDGYAVDREARQTIHAGALASQQSRPAPIWDGFKTKGGEITAGVFAGASGTTRTHQAAIVDGFSFEGKEVIGQTFIGGGMAVTGKQAAIREMLKETAIPAGGQVCAGSAAKAEAHQKPPAVREGLTVQGEAVTGAIVAATASNSKYKNTIKEGGTKNATTI